MSCADVIERPATTPAHDVKDANRMEVEITKSVEKDEEEEENAEKVPAEEFDHGTRYRGCVPVPTEVTSKLPYFSFVCFIVFPARMQWAGWYLQIFLILTKFPNSRGLINWRLGVSRSL